MKADAWYTVSTTEPTGRDPDGYVTAVLRFSESSEDTVRVIYRFRGGLHVGGSYHFGADAPADRMDTVESVFVERYGVSTLVDGYATWTFLGTNITLFPATEDVGITISYSDADAPTNRENDEEYNDLP